MKVRGALGAAYAGLAMIAGAAAFALTHFPRVAIVVGVTGTVLHISALIWALRQESRR